MSRAEALGAWVVLPGFLLVMAGAAGWWRARVFQSAAPQVKDEPLDRVHEAYPIPPPPQSPEFSRDALQAILSANPFSPQRRQVTPATDQAAEGGAAAATPPAPVFRFKGRINLGKRQRAIVEEIGTHKTYFLEVGQEVAGFKVLDIAENRVVLSDPNTHNEVIATLTSTEGP